ncbi:MAG: hypothetical protein KAX46_07945 [Chromatiaceae bacterium]|nr:hypothetical protein [Chromatiaceae bacterium]
MKAPAMTRDNPVKPSEHTPGPWKTYVSELRGGRYWTVEIPGVDDIIDIHETENGEANARLIAAAPELLEAAQAYLRWCEKSLGAGPVGNPRTHLWHNEQIRAAILKATGAPR